MHRRERRRPARRPRRVERQIRWGSGSPSASPVGWVVLLRRTEPWVPLCGLTCVFMYSLRYFFIVDIDFSVMFERLFY
jgi:hypothetical protein